MLGLGSNITGISKVGTTIVTDNLVLRHDYNLSSVEPLSSGAAFFVSSANDYVTMGDASDLSFGTGSFSVAAWVNTNQLGTTRQFLGKRAAVSIAGQGFSLYLGNSGTDWVFNVADGTDYAAPATPVAINKNQWYHVCGTFDGVAKTAKLYVDGVLEATTTNTDVGDIDVSNAFIIGGGSDSTSSQKWDGHVCNTGIWDAILSQAQVKSIMNKNYDSLSASEKTDLVSWWNLDAAYDSLVFDNHHSGGDTLGDEEITNGTFAGVTDGTDVITLSGWLAYSSPTSRNVVDNKLVIVQDGVNEGAKYLTGVLTGNYKLTVDVSGDVGLGGIYIGGTGLNVGVDTYVGQVVYYFTASSAVTIYFRAGNNSGGDTTSYTNISVKEINGNTGTLS